MHPGSRSLVLLVVLLVGAGLYAALGEPRDGGIPRSPTSEALYAVDGWSAGPEEKIDGGFVERRFTTSAGGTATLALYAHQTPKLYAAGAEVPFLGSGYSVVPAPSDLVPTTAVGSSALLASLSSEQWLVIYAFGEQRGLLGNGPRAWAFALTDAVVGRPNNYYKMFVMARVDGSNVVPGPEVSTLAATLFTRIAGFYAS